MVHSPPMYYLNYTAALVKGPRVGKDLIGVITGGFGVLDLERQKKYIKKSERASLFSEVGCENVPRILLLPLLH